METTFSCSRLRIVLFFVAVCVIPTGSRYGEFTVQSISPNSSYVARGEPLLLNVTLNTTEDVEFRWYFRRFFATFYQPVFYMMLRYHRFYQRNYGDTRFSAAARDQPSLLLVNTTLNDSGTYRCTVEILFYRREYLYFNVTVEDEPKAEITCSQKVPLAEKEDFSCWCKAIGSHLVPTATWVKNGKTLGDTTELRQKRSLLNVNSPRISSFQINASQNKSIKLMCVADGLPKPNYAITDSNGKELLGVLNGVVIVGKNSSISNATYTCIAKNDIGKDERRLNIPSSLDKPTAEITCSQKVPLAEKEDFSCWCKAIGSHLVPTATWVKNGKTLGDTTQLRQKLSLLNVSKNEAGTYICRAQLYSLMNEISTEITVYYSPRISSFQINASQNKSIKLMCVADGLPKPNYAITDSNGKELLGVLNGVVIVGKNSSISNATYTCIAKNDIGKDERRLNIPSSLDEPKAEITCLQKVTLTETEDFSCWCKAIGSHLVPTATWVKNGKTLGDTTELRQKLSLLNVSKNEAGTYICRAQLYSLMNEISTEITIYYSPRISSFQINASQYKPIKLMCVADGLPKPNYTITDSNGKELLGVSNNVVIVGKNSSICNATYTCIAKNNIGQDERRLNINNCPSSLATGQQGSSKSFNKGIEWYMVFISLIVGIIFGFGLLYGSQWIRRRRRANATNQRTQQNAASVIYTEPTTMPSSELDDYLVPYASPSQTPWEYQELDAVRANEENFYHPLHLTTRMKKAAQSTGQQ